jgi:hypothetical protein
MEDLHGYLENEKIEGDKGWKLRKALDEFDTYLTTNRLTSSPTTVKGGGTKKRSATAFVNRQ